LIYFIELYGTVCCIEIKLYFKYSLIQTKIHKRKSIKINQADFYNIFEVTWRVTIVLVLLVNFILSYYNTKFKLYNCTIHEIYYEHALSSK
jgi:hypothetical protein